jgi:site-specific recombinase XerD
LPDIARSFLDDMRLHLRPKTVAGYEAGLNLLLFGTQGKPPKIRIKKVSELSPAVVKDYQRRAASKLSARSVNKHVILLGTVLNWAVDNQLIRSNPIRGIRLLPTRPVKEQRALSEEDARELLLAGTEESREVWILFLHTGLRKREMALLEWRDVDLEQGEIVVRPEVAKSKKTRRIPMTGDVSRVLTRRKRLAVEAALHDRVLPRIEGRDFYKYVLRTLDQDLEAANIDKRGVHVHVLRRTFATRLIKAGADPKTVQTLLGHATLDLTLQFYTDAKAMDLKGALDKLGDFEVKEVAPGFRVVA